MFLSAQFASPRPSPPAPGASGRALTWLLVAAVALPLLLTAGIAWLAWQQAWHEAETEMTSGPVIEPVE